MIDIVVSLLPFLLIFGVMYFGFIRPRRRKIQELGEAAPVSAGGSGNAFLAKHSSFEVHRAVPNGVQLSDLTEAFVRAAPGSKAGMIAASETGPLGRVVMGNAWNIRISLQKGEARQKALYKAVFNAPVLRISAFALGVIMFLALSGSLFVVDVLSGMRSGGVDVSSPIVQFVAWFVVILLKFLIPLFLISVAIFPSAFGRKKIEKIIDNSLKEF